MLHGLSIWCIRHTIQHATILGTLMAHTTFRTCMNANVLYMQAIQSCNDITATEYACGTCPIAAIWLLHVADFYLRIFACFSCTTA